MAEEQAQKAAAAVETPAKKAPAPEVSETGLAVEMCEEHNRKVEIICIQDRTRICSTCTLFGQHKGHDVREEQEVVTELTIRTELLIQMY